ncbi:TPA: helix-turn-helix transcriptional regulator [Serratia marcescens]|uniref:helix-turn-helix domain-containing protein n=1 Tax=Serratia marcescens TaxID=615 RepID=UPI001A301309|nr:helix-turn-helix transcriptional regulator [Serratia marcescens]MDP8799795.1 helix-turn-helix transcriptional regulator [Serratia marcescens]HAT2866212.1 helix-turn-helix transcriptional regulator [Serratia marcescens]HAT2871807.1 helix-turn-helix transcriptional regulator [Serratia marcescens]HAT2922097.1 helix-turn-helix transcriptional regulator [Serratia marcescens]
MKTSFMTILAFHIRDLREIKGITQAEIAEKLGMTSAGWGKIENGKSSLSVENLMKFSKLINSDAGSLIKSAQSIAKQLINQGWSVSYSQVEDDGLLKAKTLSSLVDTKIDTLLQEKIGEAIKNNLANDINSTVIKYASIYAGIANLLPIKLKR